MDHDESMMLRGIPAAWVNWRPELLPFDAILHAWQKALRPGAVGKTPRSLNVYVHFPYCTSICSYCMYWRAKKPSEAVVEDYTGYLLHLLGRYRAALGRVQADAVYFGGGTPSIVPLGQMRSLLSGFGEVFEVRREWTFEANPSSLNPAAIGLLREFGVDRLSLGVQSFDPDVLDAIGRIGVAEETIADLVAEAGRLGLRVNIDLVAGLPTQNANSFRSDLTTVASMAPAEITVYRFQPHSGMTCPPPPPMSLPCLMDGALMRMRDP